MSRLATHEMKVARTVPLVEPGGFGWLTVMIEPTRGRRPRTLDGKMDSLPVLSIALADCARNAMAPFPFSSGKASPSLLQKRVC